MPTRQIITFAFGVMGTLLVLYGPFHLREEMRRLEVQILHEAVRTDNWGSPDIFAGHGAKSHIHVTDRLAPIQR